MTSKLRIAHISDPHFGTSTQEKISSLVKTLHDLKPDLVLLSGDITQRATKKQFKSAQDFCDALKPLELIATPGNHDIPLFNIFGRLFSPYYGFKHFLKRSIFTHRTVGNIDVICLNTTDRWRHVDGLLTDKDIASLEKFKSSSAVRIAMFHHPMDCAKDVDEKNLVHNAHHALPYFEKAKVDLILSGHIHDPLARLSNVRYPKGERPFVITLAGTCLSSRIRSGSPNSFNIIDIKTENENAAIDVTRYDLNEQFLFLPINQMSFKRAGRDHWAPSK